MCKYYRNNSQCTKVHQRETGKEASSNVMIINLQFFIAEWLLLAVCLLACFLCYNFFFFFFFGGSFLGVEDLT